MYNLGIDFLYGYIIMIYLTKTSKRRRKQRMRGGLLENDSSSRSSRSLIDMEEGRLLPTYDDIKTVLNEALKQFPRTTDGKIPSTSAQKAADRASSILTSDEMMKFTEDDKRTIRDMVSRYLTAYVEEPPKGGTRRRRRAKSSKKRRGKRSRRA
jgi:hypothetical protein